MRRRILLAIVAVTTAAVLAFGAPLAYAVREIEQGDVISKLEREAASAAGEVPVGVGRGDPIELPPVTAKDVTISVYLADGTLAAGNGPAQADRAVQAALQGRLAHYADAHSLSVGWPLTANEVTYGAVRASLPESSFEARVHRTWAYMGLLGLAVIAGAALLAWKQSSRLSRLVGSLTDAADRLGRGDFTVRVSEVGVAEIDGAGRALSGTAERLGRLVARERTFSADASHQLRTPLTGLQLTLEEALASGAPTEQTLRDALAAADRLEATIDDLLRLARDEHADREPVDVAPIVEAAGRSWNGRLASAGRPLRVSIARDSRPVRAAPAAVAQILEVLLSNADVHGRGTVSVRVGPTPGGMSIEVTDEGEGVTGDVERVFRRGQGTGSGIGLAFARSLAEAEGGRLMLRGSGPGPCFRLPLPAAGVDG
ncbi:MAG: hypothetical protein QOE63_1230 [Acidimicrobiaceae bacterium]